MLEKRNTWLGLLGALFVVALVVFFATGDSVALEKHYQEAMPKADHYKCYQILDWTEWEPQHVTLSDQFGKSEAQVIRPYSLCNPVDKNGEGIVDKDDHLVCYQINDDPSGEFERVREVQVQNQFGQTQLWVGVPSRELCLPSQKRLVQ